MIDEKALEAAREAYIHVNGIVLCTPSLRAAIAAYEAAKAKGQPVGLSHNDAIEAATWKYEELRKDGAVTYCMAEALKVYLRMTSPMRESSIEIRYRQALRCIVSLDDTDAIFFAKHVAKQALSDIEDGAGK